MSPSSIAMTLGVILGAVFSAATALIAVAAAQRHPVAAQPTALTVQPERWFVVERDVLVLPSATQGKLVSK